MKTSAFFALAGASMAAAHSLPIAVHVNGEDQGVGNEQGGYIRKAPSNSPVVDVTSKDMTCNVGGSTKAAKSIEVQGGDELEIEWYHNTRGDDIIDASHKGPIMTYLAPADSNGEGDVWVKIAEKGFENGEWAVINLINNGGKHSVTLPDLPAGDYILRDEILALHEGNREGGAQFYPNCIQITVTSDGSNALPAGDAIPGIYSASDDGVLFDIYNSFDSYPIPGPAVWDGASSSGGNSGSTPTPPTEGNTTPTPTPTTPSPSATPSPSKEAEAETPEPAEPETSSPATPSPSQGAGEGSEGGALPQSFTLDTFIAWLRTTAGAPTAEKLRRAHPRAFRF